MRARDNPFAAEHVERLAYRWLEGDWPTFLDRLAQHEFRGAIVGPEGTGKTTLLEQLATKLAAAGWRPRLLKLTRSAPRFEPEWLRRRLAALSRRDVVLLDGSEQLSWWRWRQFVTQTNAAGGLVITRHTPGRLPTIHQTRTTVELAQTLVEQLWGPVEPAMAELVAAQFRRHSGNTRDVLRSLYDFCAADELPASGPAAP